MLYALKTNLSFSPNQNGIQLKFIKQLFDHFFFRGKYLTPNFFWPKSNNNNLSTREFTIILAN